MNVNQKIYWAGIACISITALAFGILSPLLSIPNPINQPIVESQKSRASGFTMHADSEYQKDSSGKLRVTARMYASGPMHDDEVIRMEGAFTLITPDGKQRPMGASSWTFAENLVGNLDVSDAPKGSKVKVKGIIYAYHREDIKSEREMMADGGVRLYMNTGTVTFRKVPDSTPPQLEVECTELGSVHLHGLELLGADKKTVSNRILLMAGKQLIERENLPYLGRQIGMEPYIIRQLIPKRAEPVELIVPVRDLSTP